ncbi:protein of unknown function [Azospirillum baldaniorum]|uniref:Uncharacterized protein n=1 Tax=Azospirillum baldaniorum TaxID=1064539 RepID=A0A9P1JQC0_9PROT|nr:protein of unknown function [Azospirillum baldaniorum]
MIPPLPPQERMALKAPGEGRTRIKAPILDGTLTFPTLCVGPFPLPGRERDHQAAWP